MEFALRVWNKWATLPYFVLSAVVAYITTIEWAVYCCFSLASIFIAPMYCALIHSVNYTAIAHQMFELAKNIYICMNERTNNNTQTVRRIQCIFVHIFILNLFSIHNFLPNFFALLLRLHFLHFLDKLFNKHSFFFIDYANSSLLFHCSQTLHIDKCNWWWLESQ